MRLTCPNCDAQYEVPDEVMPKTGRDVQCSNCGQTWFQKHPDAIATPDEARRVLDDNTPDADEEISPPPPPMPNTTSAARKQLDPSVADILREEAEAERKARERTTPPKLESQPELGESLNAATPPEDEAEVRAREARARMARMRGEDPVAAAGAAGAAATSSRKDLLPDIDEINSTLRSADGAAAADEAGALAVCLYIFAPQIINAVPATEGPLTAYVSWVDQMRIALDGQVQGAAQWLDDKATASEGVTEGN